MNPTLLILAAGMGSRYGGLKQLDEVGPNGETIMDYTIYDAIQAGFDQAVFVIRKDFEEDFYKKVASKYEDEIQVDIVFQELPDFVPQHLDITEREKPWGTGHAVLVAKNKIHKPFAVFNADDFYGRGAIETVGKFLTEDIRPDLCALVGYPLEKTLSDNGTVSRGVCEVGNDNQLLNIEEKEKIEKQNGKIVYDKNGEQDTLPPDATVSMNLWGLHPSFFTILEHRFKQFIVQNYNKPKSEFFLPFVIDERLKEKNIEVKVLETESDWFGVTYKEDLGDVKENIQQLVEDDVYPTPLWSNL
jgi:NDP-sugar pyrophosphorylase family protein